VAAAEAVAAATAGVVVVVYSIRSIAVHSLTCHTATGTHMPYRITQCYLPPGRGDIPAFTPDEAGTRLSSIKLACYIPRWYNCPNTVTRPSTNRTRCALTSFMRRTPLITMPCCQLVVILVVAVSSCSSSRY